MKTALRIFGIFVATLLFLSIEIGDKPIFGHIYKLISPATKGAQKVAESFFDSSVDQTQHYSRKLFENSAPKMGDSVRSKMSGIKNHRGHPQEDLTTEDKKELDALIKSN
jgi:hypothetical protein